MKKNYLKPEVEVIDFDIKEAITDEEDGDWTPGIDGSEGWSEW